jgi:hypothetical protein
MSWIRKLIVWTVVAVSPLTGVRVVCVIEPPTGAATVQSDDALACQTMCKKRPPSTVRTRCALVEDPTCAFALGSSTAVLAEQPSLTFTLTSEPVERLAGAAYPRPTLDLASPPPKA